MTRFFWAFALLVSLVGNLSAQGPVNPAGSGSIGPGGGGGLEGAPKPKSHEVPPVVEIELVQAEWSSPGTDSAADLSGEADKVAQLVATLEKQGKLSVVQRFRLTTVDEQVASAQLGENRPQVTGVSTVGGRGGGFGGAANPGMMSSISYRSIGTMLRVTPSVRGGDTVVLDVQFEHSGVATPPNAPVLAEPPMGDKIRAESTTTLMLHSALRIANGQTAVLAGHTANDQRQFVLVTVKVKK